MDADGDGHDDVKGVPERAEDVLTPGRDGLSAAELATGGQSQPSPMTPMGQIDHMGITIQSALSSGGWRRTAVKAFAWSMIALLLLIILIAIVA